MNLKYCILIVILFCVESSILAQIQSNTNYNIPKKMSVELAKINLKNLSNYIPYRNKKKWGWIDKKKENTCNQSSI